MKKNRFEFVHLHLHSQYSLLDATIRFQELAKKVNQEGMRSVALTDHGNLFGAIEFYRTSYSLGVKPIIGCELYVAPDSRHDKRRRGDGFERGFHLTVLAQNADGYRNLVKLSSLGYTEGFYYNPRVDHNLLASYSDGLIALSGCLSSEASKHFLSGNEDAANATLNRYREIFGQKNFFLELQNHGMDEQNRYNRFLLDYAKRENASIVATNDAHYLDHSDAAAHDALLCIGTRSKIVDSDRKKYAGDQFFVKSPDEMAKLFSSNLEALKNTVEIADRIELDLAFDRHHLPNFPVPIGEGDEREYLKARCEEGLLKMRGEVNETYSNRLHHELKVITEKGFSGYFLIVADFIQEAKRRGIPVGPGRGSAAGSLVAWTLGITEVDPIKHGLLFERFLNPERTALPDIDVDICQIRREEVIDYVKQRYGEDRVAQIITFGTLGAKAVLRDTARVYDVSPQETNRIAALVPDQLKITLSESIRKVDTLKEMAEGEYAELFDTALRLEGLVRHASRHAAGIVIGNVPIMEVAPLYRDSDGHIVTQYDMTAVEALGLLKMDMLGLKTLSLIHRAISYLPGDANAEAEGLFSEEHDDPAVYELLASGHTLGVFQLDSSGIRDLITRIAPTRFEDLVAVLALYRPGPINLADEFISRKHGESEVVYELEELSEILSDSYGLILYQEQVMKIAHVVGGFTLAEADSLRKAMGKKVAGIMNKAREQFVEGAVEREHSSTTAQSLFDQMERFAGYGFNKSHAVAYAMIAYRTAWLKAHHPVGFMAALLSFEEDNHTKLGLYAEEAKRMGIPILPPDIHHPVAHFAPEGEAVRYGMAAIKHIGETACISIQETAGEKPFAGFDDFLKRVDRDRVSKRGVEALILSGAMDAFGPNRRSLATALERHWNMTGAAKDTAQISLFGDEDLAPAPIEELPEYPDALTKEFDHVGMYLHGHPLLDAFPSAEYFDEESASEGDERVYLGIVSEIKTSHDRRDREMARGALTTLRGRKNLLIFASVYDRARRVLEDGRVCVLRGREEEGGRVIVEKIAPVDKVAWHVRIRAKVRNDEELIELKSRLKKGKGKFPVDLEIEKGDSIFRVKTSETGDPAALEKEFGRSERMKIDLIPAPV